MNKGTIVLLLSLLVIFPLFFIGGPDYYSSRSFKGLWDFGHIIFFAIAACLSLRTIKVLAAKRFPVQLVIVFFASVVAGIIIEILQYGTSREADIADVYRDVIGAVAGVVWFYPSRKSINGTLLLTARWVLVLLLCLQGYPLLLTVYDEWRATNDFPVLADFESPLELDRWVGNASVSWSDKQSVSGDRSLKIDFGTQQYSGVALKYFPADWSGYSQLMFDIDNPEQKPLWITVRIHDESHRDSVQLYSDRFNRKFLLQQGWNNLVIDLADVVAAPESREMALTVIAGFGLFVIDEKSEKTVFLDNVRLVKAAP